jgi:lipoyl(octanoyl) transferase
MQKQINLYKQKNKINDIILFTEHKDVFTLGKTGDKNHLLITDKELQKEGIDYYEIDRGGDLTYHGPGQLVCYPIFNLNNYFRDTHKYLRALEEVIILTLKDYNITGTRDEEFTGVWIEEEKICAIGVKISRWITMHGLAFNLNNELKYFDKIIPCGIFHKGVTSLKILTGKTIDIKTVINKLLRNFEVVFKMKMEETTIPEINNIYKL